jgi:hypothetical protein
VAKRAATALPGRAGRTSSVTPGSPAWQNTGAVDPPSLSGDRPPRVVLSLASRGKRSTRRRMLCQFERLRSDGCFGDGGGARVAGPGRVVSRARTRPSRACQRLAGCCSAGAMRERSTARTRRSWLSLLVQRDSGLLLAAARCQQRRRPLAWQTASGKRSPRRSSSNRPRERGHIVGGSSRSNQTPMSLA